MQLHPDFRDVFNAGRNSFHVASSEGRNLQTQKYLWKFQVRTLRKPAAVSATGAEEDEQLETMAVAEPEMEVEEQPSEGEPEPEPDEEMPEITEYPEDVSAETLEERRPCSCPGAM